MQLKLLLRQFAITLVAVGVALAAYDYLRQPDIEAMRVQTAHLVESSTKQAELLSKQAQSLSDQASALKEQVANEHRQAAERKEKSLIAFYRAEGLQLSGSAKVAVAEYYFSNGEFPSSNAELGLGAPEQFHGQSLRSMHLSEGGIITLTYDAKSGFDGGSIQLIPEVGATAGLQWKCVTTDFRDIAASIPQCGYEERELL